MSQPEVQAQQEKQLLSNQRRAEALLQMLDHLQVEAIMFPLQIDHLHRDTTKRIKVELRQVELELDNILVQSELPLMYLLDQVGLVRLLCEVEAAPEAMSLRQEALLLQDQCQLLQEAVPQDLRLQVAQEEALHLIEEEEDKV